MKKLLTAYVTEYSNFYLHHGELKGIPSDWVQVTETIEVDFVETNKEEALKERIAKIDYAIIEENGKHFAEIKKLEQKKQELLSITYEVE